MEVDAEHRIRNGTHIPGWALEQGYGHNKWNRPDNEIIAMGEILGSDLRAPQQLLTPSKAKEALKKKGIDPSTIDGFYSQPPTSMKLVQDDGSKARQAFSKGEI